MNHDEVRWWWWTINPSVCLALSGKGMSDKFNKLIWSGSNCMYSVFFQSSNSIFICPFELYNVILDSTTAEQLLIHRILSQECTYGIPQSPTHCCWQSISTPQSLNSRPLQVLLTGQMYTSLKSTIIMAHSGISNLAGVLSMWVTQRLGNIWPHHNHMSISGVGLYIPGSRGHTLDKV